jgi:hypothetical protein
MPFSIDGELETFFWISLRELGIYSPSSVNKIRRELKRIEGIWFLVDDHRRIGVYVASPERLRTQIL